MDQQRVIEMTNLINDTKQAVDNSAFGPLFMHTDETAPLKKEVNQLAWMLMLHLITPLMKEFTRWEEA